MADLLSHLTFLFGQNVAPHVLERVQNILESYRGRIPQSADNLSEKDSILITYGDQLRASNEAPLQTLSAFCKKHLTDLIGGIHILPFYPSTSDDGFSVTDYRKVDPALGNWEEIASMQSNFRLMFDAVINHISSQSDWFKGFLRDDSHYRDYFIVMNGSPDLSQVVRPRALPLLSSFKTPSGEKRIWTTFSDDQIDLNYKNPDVLLEILDILLTYVEHGATFIRLDAIAYLWKEIGTSCIHLPQTHHIVQLIRAVLNEAAPSIYLITETNVPHLENISYFGNGYNESQLVYNFALPPLTLHTFNTGNANVLSRWANTLILPSNKTTFFNFLASHDGIGLNAARGILSDDQIEALVHKTLAHDGLISYKQNPDGSQSPYEMNINYFDALSNPNGNEPLTMQVDRFIASQAIMLALVGMPGIYFHSLFGSRGWKKGIDKTGRNRTINREKCELATVEEQLMDSQSLRAQVFKRYRQLLSIRRSSPAFHPHGSQKILNYHSAAFGLERISPDETSHALCLHNVSEQPISFETNYSSAKDFFTNESLNASKIRLDPYQFLWLKL